MRNQWPTPAPAQYPGFARERGHGLTAASLDQSGLPARIAGLTYAGLWAGEESARYQQIVDQFDSNAEADDASLAAVGGPVWRSSTGARQALEGENQRGIRGEP